MFLRIKWTLLRSLEAKILLQKLIFFLKIKVCAFYTFFYTYRIMDISMDPNVWGPPMWDLLFFIALKSDLDTNITEIQMLFSLLAYVLPCSSCRKHYSMYKQEVPPTTSIKKSNKLSAAQWLWTIHDMVNQNLGKICISFDKVIKKQSTITFITSDLIVFDLFVMMIKGCKKTNKVIEAIDIICKLLENISPYFELPSIVKKYEMNETNIEKQLENIKNELLLFKKIQPQSHSSYEKQYDNGVFKQ